MATRMYEVQSKIYTALNNSTELKALVNGVYDFVPEQTPVPYVTFGHILSTSEGSKTNDGEKITLTVDIWSESKGKKQAIAIIQLIESILNAEDIQLDTAVLIDYKITNREVMEESYGLYHGTVETEYQIEWI